jgi:hypothetical protein
MPTWKSVESSNHGRRVKLQPAPDLDHIKPPEWLAALPPAQESERREDRLRRQLEQAGFVDIELEPMPDAETVVYRMRRGTNANSATDQEAYVTLTAILRGAGYPVGLEELAMNLDGDTLDGAFSTRPFAEQCAKQEAREAGDGQRPQ